MCFLRIYQSLALLNLREFLPLLFVIGLSPCFAQAVQSACEHWYWNSCQINTSLLKFSWLVWQKYFLYMEIHLEYFVWDKSNKSSCTFCHLTGEEKSSDLSRRDLCVLFAISSTLISLTYKSTFLKDWWFV